MLSPQNIKVKTQLKFIIQKYINVMDYVERLYLIEMYGLLHRFGKK